MTHFKTISSSPLQILFNRFCIKRKKKHLLILNATFRPAGSSHLYFHSLFKTDSCTECNKKKGRQEPAEIKVSGNKPLSDPRVSTAAVPISTTLSPLWLLILLQNRDYWLHLYLTESELEADGCWFTADVTNLCHCPLGGLMTGCHLHKILGTSNINLAISDIWFADIIQTCSFWFQYLVVKDVKCHLLTEVIG